MSKPVYTRLGDIVNFKRGYDLPHHARQEGPYPVISSGGISGYHAAYKASGEGLVTGRYGTLGEAHYVTGNYWPHNTALYVTDFKGNYPKYVYFLMKCLGNLQTADKSTVPGINRNDLHEVKVPYHKPSEQKAIADLLWVIDDKIALNTRINAELEAMAKLLYDYWFVQFDFPNAKGKPYKSSGGAMVHNAALKREVPEGWEIQNLAECCDIIDCLHSKKSEYQFEDESSYLLQLENIKDDGLLDLARKYYVPKAEYATWTTRIEVRDGDILITNAGRVGATAQVPSGVVSGIGRNITAIRPKDIQPTYLFLAFRGEDMRRQILWNSDSGAFFKSLNVKGIKQLYVARPGKKLEEEFEKMVLPIRRMREVNQVQNQELTTLRDWLLPMLMNGQVVVGAAEEKVGLAMAAEGQASYTRKV